MELDGNIIGQNIFARTNLKTDNGKDVHIMTMGPIYIAPELKQKGYGKLLLDYSLKKQESRDTKRSALKGMLISMGKAALHTQENLEFAITDFQKERIGSFFLCKELVPDYLHGFCGENATPKGYFICDESPEDFDTYEATFPYKEKLKLPGQLF